MCLYLHIAHWQCISRYKNPIWFVIHDAYPDLITWFQMLAEISASVSEYLLLLPLLLSHPSECLGWQNAWADRRNGQLYFYFNTLYVPSRSIDVHSEKSTLKTKWTRMIKVSTYLFFLLNHSKGHDSSLLACLRVYCWLWQWFYLCGTNKYIVDNWWKYPWTD